MNKVQLEPLARRKILSNLKEYDEKEPMTPAKIREHEPTAVKRDFLLLLESRSLFLTFTSLVIVPHSMSPSHLPQDIHSIASQVSGLSDMVLIMSAAFCSVSFAAASISDIFNASDS
jgi:hypothetical protein